MLITGWKATRANAVALFRRPGTNYAAIDGVRALSQMAVMLYHCFFLARLPGDSAQFKQFLLETPWYLGWVWTLDYSVDAFFVISGYLIATLLFREHDKTGDINLKRFYWRRYLRLTPAYFVFILMFIALSPTPQPNVWANFMYVNNFIPLAEMSVPWTWSLAVEEQFYLVFPAILLFFALRGSRPLARLCVLLLASQACALAVFMTDDILWNSTNFQIYFDNTVFHHYYDRFYVNLHTRFGPFVSGTIAAYVFMHYQPTLAALRANKWLFNGINLAALAFIAYALGINPYSENGSVAASRWHLIVDRNLFGIALSWVLVAVHGPAGLLRPLKAFLEWKVWYPIAQLSYTMYLFHYIIVIFVMSNLLGNLKHFGLIGNGQTFPYEWMLVAYVAVVILTLIPATILHLLVEKPFMQLRDSLGKRTRPVAAPAAEGANSP